MLDDKRCYGFLQIRSVGSHQSWMLFLEVWRGLIGEVTEKFVVHLCYNFDANFYNQSNMENYQSSSNLIIKNRRFVQQR